MLNLYAVWFQSHSLWPTFLPFVFHLRLSQFFCFLTLLVTCGLLTCPLFLDWFLIKPCLWYLSCWLSTNKFDLLCAFCDPCIWILTLPTASKDVHCEMKEGTGCFVPPRITQSLLLMTANRVPSHRLGTWKMAHWPNLCLFCPSSLLQIKYSICKNYMHEMILWI